MNATAVLCALIAVPLLIFFLGFGFAVGLLTRRPSLCIACAVFIGLLSIAAFFVVHMIAHPLVPI